MPLIKSAKKRVRVSEHKAEINNLQRTGAKTAVRTATRAINGKATDAAELTRQAASRLDRAAQKHAIHPNKAARLKSRLSAKLKAAGIETPKAAKPVTKKSPAKKPAAKSAK